MDKIAFKKKVAALFHNARPLSLRRSSPRGIRVLNYHSITKSSAVPDPYQMTTPAGLFEQQMSLLKSKGCSVISCEEISGMLNGRAQIPENAVSITFDDGFRDNLDNALPVLEGFGFPATFFITTGFIGKGDAYLDRHGLERLSRSALASFGAHTVSHEKMYGMKCDALKYEAGSSKRSLEDIIRKPVAMFAYPFGSYGSFDELSKSAVRAVGFESAFTTIAGYNRPGRDPYEIRRTRISWCDDEDSFLLQLEGSYDWYSIWQMLAKTP